MSFLEKTVNAIKKFDSLVCVGIDPDLKKIPAFLWELFRPYAKNEKNLIFLVVYKFCVDIVDAVAPYCAAFKPNLAFFEDLGPAGSEMLRKLCAYIKKNYPDHVLILDGKRGDIGNTATHYAKSLADLGADVVTVNPYLGPRTLDPFLENGLGILALCVTSNSDAAIFQNLMVNCGVEQGQPVYQKLYLRVAEVLANQHTEKHEHASLWKGNLGLVTGATHPKELGEVRQLVGNDVVLLIPGIGKQGGALEETILNNGNGPAIINVSRSVLYASSGEDFAGAAGAETERTKKEINIHRAKVA